MEMEYAKAEICCSRGKPLPVPWGEGTQRTRTVTGRSHLKVPACSRSQTQIPTVTSYAAPDAEHSCFSDVLLERLDVA